MVDSCLTIPSSKSHTLRALLFAGLASGESKIYEPLFSPDTKAMMDALSAIGAKFEVDDRCIKVVGFAGKPKAPSDVIQCGNSGQVLRFVGALAGLIPSYSIFTGDLSIRSNRPVKPLLEAMEGLGAFAKSSRGDGRAPILIKGPFTKNKTKLDGEDSQPVSGLLIAASFAPFPIEIEVSNPGEKPWIDLTLDWLKRFDIAYKREGYTRYQLKGGAKIEGFSYLVPGDFSSAAFPIAAALITHSELTLHNLDWEDVQGDKKLLVILEKMGAQFEINPKKRLVKVLKGSGLRGIKIDINDCIDALPILAVLGCFASGTTEIFNGAIARKKESDRIICICMELKKMGAQIEEREDGLIVQTSKLHGAKLQSHLDHRIAMSLAVAALGASSPSTISEFECVAKSYPNFPFGKYQ